MNGVRYYVSLVLFVILCLMDVAFASALLAVIGDGAGPVIATLIFLVPLLFATKKCYSYHKKIASSKSPAANPVRVYSEEDSDDPLWMAERKGISVQSVANNGGRMNDRQIKITLSGDSGSDYGAVVEIKNSKLFIQCSCPAGQSMTRCKHALSLLAHDFSIVKDSSEKAAVSEFFNSFKISPYDAPLVAELEAIEKKEKELKEKKKSLKKQMDRLFFEGIPVE